jgi:glycine cleavage system pyridoxal-binding protein P
MATIVDQDYTSTDIIRKDLQRGGFTKEEEKFLQGLAILIKQNKAVVVRHKNTVFVGIKTGVNELEVHMYTLDNQTTMAEAMKIAFDTVKKAGVKKLKSETDNPKVITLLKTLGAPLDVKKKGKKYAWTLDIAK